MHGYSRYRHMGGWFFGQAGLTVRGMNDHCLGPPSDTLKITIHDLPTMTSVPER